MTELSRPVRRKTPITVRESGKVREVVVELHAGYLSIWPLGLACKHSYDLDYHSLYTFAVQRTVAQRSREKRELAAKKKAGLL